MLSMGSIALVLIIVIFIVVAAIYPYDIVYGICRLTRVRGSVIVIMQLLIYRYAWIIGAYARLARLARVFVTRASCIAMTRDKLDRHESLKQTLK